jgi:hypothetical protein
VVVVIVAVSVEELTVFAVIVDDVIVEDGPDKGVDFPEEEDRTGLC